MKGEVHLSFMSLLCTCNCNKAVQSTCNLRLLCMFYRC